MPTSKSGPWQKLVPIARWLSDHVTMAATMKSVQNKKNDIVSWNRPGSQFTNFTAHSLNPWSALWLCLMFLTSSVGHCTWPLSVPLGGWMWWWWWWGGCFGREHFLLFLSGTVWYAALLHCDNARLVAGLKAGFVYTNSSEETKVHEKLLPLLQLLNLTSCPPCSESNPPLSPRVQDKLKTKCSAC